MGKKSIIINQAFSGLINKQELNYREQIQPKEQEFDSIPKWISRIDDGRRDILPILYRFVDFKGEILELGAGSCWFGSELSRLKNVNKVYCLEMSKFILTNISPHIMLHLNADLDKIVRVIGDFHKLDFPDNTFDYIVFDASMHHVPEASFFNVFTEIRRILKKDGLVVAIREPTLIPIPILNRKQKMTFGLHEKQYGVTENLFSRLKWSKMFKSAGFRCKFIPYGFRIGKKVTLKNIVKRMIYSSPFRNFFLYLRNYHCLFILSKMNTDYTSFKR